MRLARSTPRLLVAAALVALWMVGPARATGPGATGPAEAGPYDSVDSVANGSVAAGVSRPAAHPPTETRALWVLRTSLISPKSIDALVRRARDSGFNTLLVQVRGRADAYYRGGLEPPPADLLRQPAAFDPLATVISTARSAGLRVHAWININLVSSAVALPSSRAHLVHRHPEWLMVPRDIAQELAGVPTRSPAYVGKLARWARAQSEDVEGLYVSPTIPAAQAHAEAVVRDISRRYALDGIHFDYARYPTERFDYSRAAIAQFRTTVRGTIDAQRRRAIDASETVDLFAWPDAFPEAWRAFRVARMTTLMRRLSAAVKAERPSALVSVAAAPARAEALAHRLQDWGAWLGEGLVDAVAPMAYTQEAEIFAEQIADARQAAGTRAVWAGIGAYRLSPAQTIENIHTARRLGANGVVLFSYDSLINPQQTAPDYLPTVGRAVFPDRRSTDTGSR
jgi:uncharacterized lipoprotein YddW (UPF0748 family)